jgi:hypothetical protein
MTGEQIADGHPPFALHHLDEVDIHPIQMRSIGLTNPRLDHGRFCTLRPGESAFDATRGCSTPSAPQIPFRDQEEEQMQQNVMTRTLVSAATVLVIAAGSLASAGVSFAAPAPGSKPAVSPEGVAPLAVENLGLSVPEAMKVQDWLKQWWSYTGEINGQLDTESWKAFQRFLAAYWSYPGEINGTVGSDTVKALQRMLKVQCGYTGKIDGVAGPDTRAAFKRFANN